MPSIHVFPHRISSKRNDEKKKIPRGDLDSDIGETFDLTQPKARVLELGQEFAIQTIK